MTPQSLIEEIKQVNKQKDLNKIEQDAARKRGDTVMLTWLENRYNELCEEIELKLEMATLLDAKGKNQINPIQLIEMVDSGKIPMGQMANPDKPKKVKAK